MIPVCQSPPESRALGAHPRANPIPVASHHRAKLRQLMVPNWVWTPSKIPQDASDALSGWQIPSRCWSLSQWIVKSSKPPNQKAANKCLKRKFCLHFHWQTADAVLTNHVQVYKDFCSPRILPSNRPFFVTHLISTAYTNINWRLWKSHGCSNWTDKYDGTDITRKVWWQKD